ncbi:MAG: hypothetical protein ACK5XN_37080 [Bacteroidota bacterium]|jgi:hypothetical protein
MNINNTHSTLYRLEYFEGYKCGLDPAITINRKKHNDAFTTGFMLGRLEFESMNGSLSNGVPRRIVTTKVLEDFQLAGMLGLSIDTADYTSYQLHIILQWYQSGIEQYEPEQSSYLIDLLEQNGIEIG